MSGREEHDVRFPALFEGMMFERLSLWSLRSTEAPQTQQSLLALSGQTLGAFSAMPRILIRADVLSSHDELRVG